MAKHETFKPQAPSKKDQKIHPIWRGVGFIFMILIPFISYAAARMILQQNLLARWITPDMYAKRGELLFNMFHDPMIYVMIVLILAIAFVLFSLFSLVAFAISSMFGQSRYGPYDLPPVAKPRGVKMRSR